MPVKYFIKSHNEIIAESSDPKKILKALKIIPMIKCMGCTYNTCDRNVEDELFSNSDGDVLVLPMCVGYVSRKFQVYLDNDYTEFDTYQDAMKFAYANQQDHNLSLEEALILQKHINYIKQEESKLDISGVKNVF